MDLSIEHETVYRYDHPVNYSIQILHLAPRDHDGQNVKAWRLSVSDGGKLTPFEDGFGNRGHSLTINGPHDEVRVQVTGQVRTTDAHGVVAGTFEPLPPLVFLRQTALTAETPELRALAAKATAAASPDRIESLHGLMTAVRGAIDYRVGATHVETTAGEALRHGYGVCQDHAHVFCACARVLGIPARYVSGYMWGGDVADAYEASHAWAEAYVEGLGWIGFDVANSVCPTDAYVRVAVGLDYAGAAPIRGRRRGGGVESLNVNVAVGQAQQ